MRKDGAPWQMILSKENCSWSMSFEPRSLAIKVAITTLWVGSKDSNASKLNFWLPVGCLTHGKTHLFLHTKCFEEIRNQALKKFLPSCLCPFFNLVILPELLNGTVYYEINRLGPDSPWAGCPPTLWYKAFPGLSECGCQWLLISARKGTVPTAAWVWPEVWWLFILLANGSAVVSEPSVTERPNQRVESNSKTSHILEYVLRSALIVQKQPGIWVSAAIKLLAVISWGAWLSFVRDFLPSLSRWLNWLQLILLGSTQLFSHNPAVISMT